MRDKMRKILGKIEKGIRLPEGKPVVPEPQRILPEPKTTKVLPRRNGKVLARA